MASKVATGQEYRARMPELPEVETVRRGLAPLVVGRRVLEVDSHPSAKFVAARDVVGARIDGVGRRGKYLLLPLDDGRRLVAHLGMTGGFVHGREPHLDPYVRAWWRFDDGTHLQIGLVPWDVRFAPRGARPTEIAAAPSVRLSWPGCDC